MQSACSIYSTLIKLCMSLSISEHRVQCLVDKYGSTIN